MAGSKLPRWDSTIPLLEPVAANINKIVDTVNSLSPITGSDGIVVVTEHGGGTAVRRDPGFKPGFTILVKIISIATGGGKYNAMWVYSDSTAIPSENLAMPEVMLLTGNNDCMYMNLWENALGDVHTLPVGSFHLGRIAGRTPETSPRAIVVGMSAPSVALFAVTVTQTGGYNGTGTWPYGSSPASWTYTVKTADGTVTLGVDIQLTKLRSNGAVNPGNGFGLAFFQANGNLQLWDAGETPS